jgi:hypothetical protein
MFVFGSGVLIGTQLNVPNPTPINFGLIQKVSVDTSVSVKELYGQFAFPVAVGSGTRKVTCKASLARFSAQALGRLFYNQTPTLGSTISSFAEVGHVPASSPFTVTPLNAPHFVSDQGVTYAATGLPLVNVATLTAAGQYSFNPTTGVYTFNTADQGLSVLITYNYAASSTVATTTQNLTIGNPVIGPTSTFSALLFATDPTNNAQFSVTLNQCVASKFSFDTNIEDFAKPDFEFQAFANAAGQVMTFNFGDLS